MRFVVLVIDSFGIGELPDAEKYGDTGSNTALHICESVPGPKWPNLKAFGLGNASELLGNPLPGCEAVEQPRASYGVMMEKSPGKDTTTGHWELAGIELDRPFRILPPEHPSFPQALITELEQRSGRRVIGNRAASGTVIIEELGEQHQRSGDLICYTSGDSVFQIAAHEEVIPIEEQYAICRIARELCDQYQIGRVIARPFLGEPGSFKRTVRRKDFSIPLPGPTIMDHLAEREINTVAVGKIGDIFNEQGIRESYHDKGNTACLSRTLELLRRPVKGKEFIFVNLVDTDMIYGHRRDPEGYLKAVEEIDAALPGMLKELSPEDVLVLTADHGCDPTYKGTDHTREYVPILCYSGGAAPRNVGVRKGFSDLAQTVAKWFQAPPYPRGVSLF